MISLKPTLGDIKEINTKEELEAVIEREKQAILNDDKLVSEFSEIAKLLDKNIPLRNFRDYLMENRHLVPHLADIVQFRQEVIKSYIKENEESYRILVETYADVRAKQEEIEQAAREQETLWKKAIDTFNTRFRVPFSLTVKNQASVVMGRDKLMQLGFTYHSGGRNAEFAKEDLLEILSQGERRAFYILNVIFEVQRRIKDSQETLIVVDDIADSFDYQNKYAIVQYLYDISETDLFKMIVLTHNFDFFRTVQSRLSIHRDHCLMASKTDAGIKLEKAIGIRNIFSNDWKKAFFTNDVKKIACIPFLRNLIELREGTSDPDYLRLTSMLHWKANSTVVTVSDLDAIYNRVCGVGGPSADGGRLVTDVIFTVADGLPPPAGLNLENKIVLAIAIRMGAERYMVDKIADPVHWAGIKRNQTPELIKKFKALYPAEDKAADVLDRVALMTPENIHLNAFMYEPIIDMSEEHLRALYADVKALA